MKHEHREMISLLIPTLNAGTLWPNVLDSIALQNYPIGRKIIVDSGSGDDTVAQALAHGFEVIHINKEAFNHGATRQLLINEVKESAICVFLTQDAILASENSVSELIKVFSDQGIGMAYGRQLPHDQAKPLEIHARRFNYTEKSATRTFADKETLGFKVFFCSNSFAAYRRNILLEAGGFPSESIMGEDALVAAKMLMMGFKIAYAAEAIVKHSHSYTFKEEFKRYFDTRVFHEQNQWLIAAFGKPTGEGLKYLRSELSYVIQQHPASIFKSMISISGKWLGYTLGQFYQRLPLRILKNLSMHRNYWK